MVPARHPQFRTLCTGSGRLSRTTLPPKCPSALRTIALFCLFACFASCLPLAAAQQIYTQALAIIDAPQRGSIYHSGAPLPIAIDVSGNGKLQNAAAIPGSGLPTRFDFFEIYLVSSQANLNLTVSQGTGFLTQESGSTVKHVNYNVPGCTPPGIYNLTLYEGSTVDSTSYYTVTPILLEIQNTNQSGDCKSSSNLLQAQPQPSNPPPTNPWTGNPQPKDTVATTPPVASNTVGVSQTPAASSTLAKSTTVTEPTSVIPITAGQGVVTVTVGPSGLAWPFTLTTVAPSASGSPGATITRKVADGPTTVTVVLVSETTQTLTTTIGGQPTTQTTTLTSLSTTTAVMDNGPGDTAGFFPVNAAGRSVSALFIGWTCAVTTGLSLILLY